MTLAEKIVILTMSLALVSWMSRDKNVNLLLSYIKPFFFTRHFDTYNWVFFCLA